MLKLRHVVGDLSGSLGSPPWPSAREVDGLLRVLLPALSMTTANLHVNNLAWEVLQQLPVGRRFGLYKSWEESNAGKFPLKFWVSASERRTASPVVRTAFSWAVQSWWFESVPVVYYTIRRMFSCVSTAFRVR